MVRRLPGLAVILASLAIGQTTLSQNKAEGPVPLHYNVMWMVAHTGRAEAVNGNVVYFLSLLRD